MKSRTKRCPIIRYSVDEYTLSHLKSGDLKLQVMRDGHAEVLESKTSDCLGWLSRQQVQKIRKLL